MRIHRQVYTIKLLNKAKILDWLLLFRAWPECKTIDKIILKASLSTTTFLSRVCAITDFVLSQFVKLFAGHQKIATTLCALSLITLEIVYLNTKNQFLIGNNLDS